MKTQLIIPQIAGDVHLGCLPEERIDTQKISVGLKITFSQPPETCTSDDVKQVPCYAQMTDVLHRLFAEKHYNTIEHLGFVSFNEIKKYLQSFDHISQLKVELNKLNPPVESISQGCLFVVEDKV